MLKGSSDIWTGVGFLAIAGAFFAQYPESEGVSRIFPETLMSLIALGGVYYLIRGLLEHRYECGEDGCAGENWQNIFWVTFMSVVYALSIVVLGYWVSTCLFLVLCYIGLVFFKMPPKKAFLNAVVFGGGFSFIVWLGFVKIMAVPTPQGAFSLF